MNTAMLRVVATAEATLLPGQWIEAGTVIGTAPDLGMKVRAPHTGVVKRVDRFGDLLEIVLERRRDYDEYDEMDD